MMAEKAQTIIKQAIMEQTVMKLIACLVAASVGIGLLLSSVAMRASGSVDGSFVFPVLLLILDVVCAFLVFRKIRQLICQN